MDQEHPDEEWRQGFFVELRSFEDDDFAATQRHLSVRGGTQHEQVRECLTPYRTFAMSDYSGTGVRCLTQQMETSWL